MPDSISAAGRQIEVECPECDGRGAFIREVIVCCRGSDWECGASGRTGHRDEYEVEECGRCRGCGKVWAVSINMRLLSNTLINAGLAEYIAPIKAALAAATGTAKTAKQAECEASQSGGSDSERNAPNSSPSHPSQGG